jgi:hypothetical protein
MTEENGSNNKQREEDTQTDEEEQQQQESAKKAKYEALEPTFYLPSNPELDGISLNTLPPQSLTTNLYISRTSNFLDFIWKVDIPQQSLQDDDLFQYETIKKTDDLSVNISLIHPAGSQEFTFTINIPDKRQTNEIESASADEKPLDKETVNINDFGTPYRTNCNGGDVNVNNLSVPKLNSQYSTWGANDDNKFNGLPDEYYNLKAQIHLINRSSFEIFNLNFTANSTQRKDFTANCNDYLRIIISIDITKFNNKKTGYHGLINEGMTCYMNSILQTLNLLGYFKKALFKIPLNLNDRQSVPYSLCKLFHDLTIEDRPISTNRLISSFGWGRDDVLVQHDVQEFNLKLSEFIENKMKGTEAEGTFDYLFQGKVKTYIECLNIEYKSEKEEKFHDLQLNVKGCKDIYESFDKYVEVEILNGNNQYDAEGFGKQDARKGLKFIKLPNVLILQLKRFEYNPTTFELEKINDRFEYYDQINMDKYIKIDNGVDSTGNTYSLYSVLVHSGSVNFGHYYCYCKVSGNWLKFNDAIVKFAEIYEVFENNFGGECYLYKYINNSIRQFPIKSDSNAYVLVYIKDSEAETILSQITQEDVIVSFNFRFQNNLKIFSFWKRKKRIKKKEQAKGKLKI